MSETSAIVRALQCLVVGLLVCASSPVGRAQDGGEDPTAISPALTELLKGASGVSDQGVTPPLPVDENIATPQVRLKAVVLRDRDHGSAIIALDDDDFIMIPLERPGQSTTPYELSLGNNMYIVEDFSATHVRLRDRHSDNAVLIH